jgi:hypothetical protein
MVGAATGSSAYRACRAVIKPSVPAVDIFDVSPGYDASVLDSQLEGSLIRAPYRWWFWWCEFVVSVERIRHFGGAYSSFHYREYIEVRGEDRKKDIQPPLARRLNCPLFLPSSRNLVSISVRPPVGQPVEVDARFPRIPTTAITSTSTWDSRLLPRTTRTHLRSSGYPVSNSSACDRYSRPTFRADRSTPTFTTGNRGCFIQLFSNMTVPSEVASQGYLPSIVDSIRLIHHAINMTDWARPGDR